jgi:hypothetical protein
MSSIKYLFSRFGGHALQFGYGKSSSLDLPTDQSFENIMPNFATEMNGFSYLTSYQMNPEFMGSFQKLPTGYCTKLGSLEHLFIEVILSYDVYVNSDIYFCKTKYSNVFSFFIKTDFKPLELSLGKIKSSYDNVLFLRVLNHSNEEIENKTSRIINIMLCLLIHHMDIIETKFTFNPSKTIIGKNFDDSIFDDFIVKLKSAQSNQEIKEILSL